ncbi:hypothetical protein Pla52o_10950 [Novipirellula galeiformis]|uniref:Uncharacterized protein n=1 Tax=Novipirellula galeiformis TaxID=2528004 RepID=A0A5C6CUY1_9BACT|nr:hypothetical protein Pla52o_10950 [Novipirellula galeiformis]
MKFGMTVAVLVKPPPSSPNNMYRDKKEATGPESHGNLLATANRGRLNIAQQFER